MGDFIKGFFNSWVYIPFLILIFLGIIYLIKVYFELRQIRVLLKVNESATRDLCTLIDTIDRQKRVKSDG